MQHSVVVIYSITLALKSSSDGIPATGSATVQYGHQHMDNTVFKLSMTRQHCGPTTCPSPLPRFSVSLESSRKIHAIPPPCQRSWAIVSSEPMSKQLKLNYSQCRRDENISNWDRYIQIWVQNVFFSDSSSGMYNVWCVGYRYEKTVLVNRYYHCSVNYIAKFLLWSRRMKYIGFSNCFTLCIYMKSKLWTKLVTKEFTKIQPILKRKIM